MDNSTSPTNSLNNLTDIQPNLDENPSDVFNTWEDFDLNQNLLRGIYAYGFEKPSPIQKKAIIPIQQNKDVIAQAQSGTGKTGAFGIGFLNKVNLEQNKIQYVILAPTRELSRQIFDFIVKIGSFMKKLQVQLLIGGTSIDRDISELRNNTPHIIVGCPGRIHDMFRREYIIPSTIRAIILDEADEMLSYGFKDQVYNILQYLRNDIQICLFSATIPNELDILTEKFMRTPTKILIKAEMLTLEGIAQYYIALEDDQQKYLTLKDLYKTISVSQCIIYCNSIKRVQQLYEAMLEDEFPVCCIHSDMERTDRENSYNEFKNGKNRVLISSNVTARGIDIQQVSIVINFDMPKCIHNYLHRIGRSGRWGRKGVGINLITRRDYSKVKELEDFYCTQIRELPENFVI